MENERSKEKFCRNRYEEVLRKMTVLKSKAQRVIEESKKCASSEQRDGYFQFTLHELENEIEKN